MRRSLPSDVIRNVECFNDVVKGSAFVDKTLFIKDFVENAATNPVQMITAPRRFGKSINICMLRDFLQIQGDQAEKKAAYVLFTQTKVSSTGKYLEISKHAKFLKKHLGKHPVVFISLLNVKGEVFDTVFAQLKEEIHELFKKHEPYLSNSLLLKKDEKLLLQKYASDIDYQSLTEAEVVRGLRRLCGYVNKHFGEKVVVLVDEHDAPIQYGVGEADHVKRVVLLLEKLFCNVFKSNENLQFALLTGVLPLITSTDQSPLNNIEVYTFLNNPFYFKYYGFNESEVKTVLSAFLLPKEIDAAMDDLCLWYNGYGNMSDDRIYCPHAITGYLRSGYKLISYWGFTSSIEDIKQVISNSVEFRSAIEELVRGEDFTFNVVPVISVQDVNSLSNLILQQKCSPNSFNQLFTLLLHLGYLTAYTYELTTMYRIPNLEIKLEFSRFLSEFYKLSTGESLAVEAFRNLFSHTTADLGICITSLETCLENYFQPLMSGALVVCNEAVCCTLLSILMLQVNVKMFGNEVPCCFRRKTNRPTRADIVCTKDDLGIVIEVKYGGTALTALKQIHENGYGDIFTTIPNITRVLKAGISISKVTSLQPTVKKPKVKKPKVNSEEKRISFSIRAVVSTVPKTKRRK